MYSLLWRHRESTFIDIYTCLLCFRYVVTFSLSHLLIFFLSERSMFNLSFLLLLFFLSSVLSLPPFYPPFLSSLAQTSWTFFECSFLVAGGGGPSFFQGGLSSTFPTFKSPLWLLKLKSQRKETCANWDSWYGEGTWALELDRHMLKSRLHNFE